jgi:hypothetical protein
MTIRYWAEHLHRFYEVVFIVVFTPTQLAVIVIEMAMYNTTESLLVVMEWPSENTIIHNLLPQQQHHG